MTKALELADMRAMILAAGKGTRLRPLTDITPKPLVKVAGRALIDYSFDLLRVAGIRHVVVNKHHLADQIDVHMASQPEFEIDISDETVALLETGGGVLKALPLLGRNPFFVLNSDVIVRDSGASSLQMMAARWDADEMDVLLLLHPTETAIGYDGQGDFFMDDPGKLTRRHAGIPAPYMFTGAQLLNPALFAGCPDGPFSLNRIYDKAAAKGRLFGLRHEGQWLHVGTEEALAAASKKLDGS
ncbi:MAG: mannose-1-phosphate guanylyltransferase [Sneathiella sp.]|nr:MAG: mannose-1-phosphate guanylyltransferase [Sneathiella sp.]